MRTNLGLFDWDEGLDYAFTQIEALKKKYPSLKDRIKIHRYEIMEEKEPLYGLQFIAEDMFGYEYLTANTGVGFTTLQGMKKEIDRALKAIETGLGKIEYIR